MTPLVRSVLRRDFHAFAVRAFSELYNGAKLVEDEYIEVLIDYLMRMNALEFQKLIVNLPPRHLKSFLISVAFVAWRMGLQPHLKFMVVSNSSQLAEQLHQDCRRIIESDFYQEVFPEMAISNSANTKEYVETTVGGGRRAFSLDGSSIGHGADLLIFDDPISPSDAKNSERCHDVLASMTEKFISRLNHPRGPVILVHQRLGEEDPSGLLLRKGGWRHLSLPIVAVEHERHELLSGKVIERFPGGLLSPGRISLADVDSLRNTFGAEFQSQHQQNPQSDRGFIFKREDIPRVSVVPDQLSYVISVDTAPHGESGTSHTAVLVIGYDKVDSYVVNAISSKLEYLEIIDVVVARAARFGAKRIIVEKAGLGHAVAGGLRAKGLLVDEHPHGGRSKVERANAVIGHFKSGAVRIRDNEPWTDGLIDELLRFPNGALDDQVDAVTQYLAWRELHPINRDDLRVWGGKQSLVLPSRQLFTREDGLERRVPFGLRGHRGR